MYHIPMLRVQVVREGSMPADRRRIAGPADVARILREYFQDLDREVFLIVLLNTKHDVTGIHQVSVGTLSASLIHAREVFKAAILGNAAAIVAVHNHPSGDPTPSTEDRELTQRLWSCGELLGIALLDHLILGEGETFFSCQKAGLLARDEELPGRLPKERPHPKTSTVPPSVRNRGKEVRPRAGRRLSLPSPAGASQEDVRRSTSDVQGDSDGGQTEPEGHARTAAFGSGLDGGGGGRIPGHDPQNGLRACRQTEAAPSEAGHEDSLSA